MFRFCDIIDMVNDTVSTGFKVILLYIMVNEKKLRHTHVCIYLYFYK